MASKSGTGKKIHSESSDAAPDRDRLIAELKGRIHFLEGELRSRNAPRSSSHADCERAESALRENEKFLNNIFNCIQDGLTILNKDLTVLRHNPTIEKWHGRNLIGNKCYRLFHGRDAPCENCPSLRAMGEGSMQTEVVRDLIGWKELYAYPLINDDGEVTGVVEQVRDITERMQADAALQESEDRYRATFEQAAVGMTHVGRDGRFLRVNDKFCEITGYGREELVGRSVRDITYGPDMAGEALLIQRIIAGELPTYSFEKRYIRKDGAIIWVNLTVTPIYENGTLEYLMGVTEDVTERKRAEKELRLTQFYIDRAADIALWVAPDARFIYANDAACQTFGYTKEEFLGLTAFDTNPHFNEENWGAHWKEIKERGSFTIEASLRRKDGTRFPGEITVNYIVYEGREYNCSYIHDITERKRAEDELRAAKAQAELYVDLMGHDINNMNQIALGYLELAQGTLDYEGRLERENAMLLAKPMETLRNASTLIDNVRKLQREKAGLYALSRIDLDGLLRDVKSHYATVPGRDVAIDYRPCPGDCAVQANELLRDVFTNLVGNAVKHSRNTEKLVVGIRVEKVRENGRAYCRVNVEDNGPGIPDAMKMKLFDRLSLDSTRARGKGFGLCLIKMLVDDYDGKFWVEDRVEGDHAQGARFVVVLPTAEKPEK